MRYVGTGRIAAKVPRKGQSHGHGETRASKWGSNGPRFNRGHQL